MTAEQPFIQDLFFNTEDRNSGVNYNAAWNLDPRQIKSMDNGFDVSLLEFSMKNLNYPTNSYNNKIYLEEKSSGTVNTAVIPAGSYDIAGYLVFLKAALEAASQNTLVYTCTYDPYTARITISTTQAFRFRYSTANYTGFNHAYNQLGIDLASQVEGTSATSLQAAYPFVLNGSASIVIVSNLALSNYCSDHMSNVLAQIPINVGYGDTMTYMAQATGPVATGQRILDRVELGLFDEYGNAYILPANVAVTYRLRISCRPSNKMYGTIKIV